MFSQHEGRELDAVISLGPDEAQILLTSLSNTAFRRYANRPDVCSASPHKLDGLVATIVFRQRSMSLRLAVTLTALKVSRKAWNSDAPQT